MGRKKVFRNIGIVLILLAIIFNPILVEKTFSQDKKFDFPEKFHSIIVLDVIIALVGLFFIIMPKERKQIILLLVSFLVCIIIMELILNLVPKTYENNRYGWSTPVNTTLTNTIENSPGVLREVNNTYYDHGFRRWGDINTSKTKVFIIGDSFTQVLQVNNGEEWYSYLEPEFELFVYGAGSYGSLQEHMILEDYIDIIHPDVIIWQFEVNDYHNNLYEYDRKDYPLNTHWHRPYLEEGEIVYRLPVPLSKVRTKSALINNAMLFIDYLLERSYDKEYVFQHELKTESFKVTKEIMSNVRNTSGNIPIYFFNSKNPIREYEKILCEENNFICIEEIYEVLKKQEQPTEIADGHWNLMGNQVVGEFLAEYFKTQPLPSVGHS